MDFERDPAEFSRRWSNEEAALKERIRRAQGMLPSVEIEEARYCDAAKIGAALHVDGHRADITLLKTAATMAAFAGEAGVTRAHILAAAKMVLPHRMRLLPFDTTDGLPSDLEAIIDA